MKGLHELVLIIVAAGALATGCGEKTEIAKAPGCNPNITPTGKKEKVADFIKPTSCLGVVLMCNYCEYKPEGTFLRSGSEPCGGCIGADF